MLYLIAHKVRGEAAFDIAESIECPICGGIGCAGPHTDYEGPSCDQCEGKGRWWIIPTSGHRAYPYWYISLEDIWTFYAEGYEDYKPLEQAVPTMPEGIRDHYELTKTQKPSDRTFVELNLADLGL